MGSSVVHCRLLRLRWSKCLKQYICQDSATTMVVLCNSHLTDVHDVILVTSWCSEGRIDQPASTVCRLNSQLFTAVHATTNHLQGLIVGICCTQAGHEVLQLEAYEFAIDLAPVLGHPVIQPLEEGPPWLGCREAFLLTPHLNSSPTDYTCMLFKPIL